MCGCLVLALGVVGHCSNCPLELPSMSIAHTHTQSIISWIPSRQLTGYDPSSRSACGVKNGYAKYSCTADSSSHIYTPCTRATSDRRRIMMDPIPYGTSVDNQSDERRHEGESHLSHNLKVPHLYSSLLAINIRGYNTHSPAQPCFPFVPHAPLEDTMQCHAHANANPLLPPCTLSKATR